MRTRVFSLVTGVALLLAVGPVTAHHAFNSEFDANKPVKVRGTVSKVEWINPHAWIHMDVKRRTAPSSGGCSRPGRQTR